MLTIGFFRNLGCQHGIVGSWVERVEDVDVHPVDVACTIAGRSQAVDEIAEVDRREGIGVEAVAGKEEPAPVRRECRTEIELW